MMVQFFDREDREISSCLHARSILIPAVGDLVKLSAYAEYTRKTGMSTVEGIVHYRIIDYNRDVINVYLK